MTLSLESLHWQAYLSRLLPAVRQMFDEHLSLVANGQVAAPGLLCLHLVLVFQPDPSNHHRIPLSGRKHIVIPRPGPLFQNVEQLQARRP
jgi:hypothetical protein